MWESGSYKTYCDGNDWLWYTNITSSAPGSSGTTQQMITPHSDIGNYVFYVNSAGNIGSYAASSAREIRPVLYLKLNVQLTGGIGTWDDPYVVE